MVWCGVVWCEYSAAFRADILRSHVCKHLLELIRILLLPIFSGTVVCEVPQSSVSEGVYSYPSRAKDL